MNLQTIAAMLGVGLGAGVIGGMFGIGGGLIIVPALILIMGIDQKMATGTSLLAQLLPVGLLGVLEYRRRGQILVGEGLCIAAGLLVGMLVGARLTGLLSPGQMKRAYGAFLIGVGLYFLFYTPMTPRPTVPPPATTRAGDA